MRYTRLYCDAWFFHRLLTRLGFLELDRGYFTKATWRWDFWNGSRSWWALRYLHRHGWESYKARFAGGR